MNSLRGGVAVFNYYLKHECSGNMLCATKKFKGIQSTKTMDRAYKLINVYNTIMELEKKRDPEAFGINGKKPTPKLGERSLIIKQTPKQKIIIKGEK